MTAAPSHTPIRGLAPNVFLDGTYAVHNPQVGVTRAGKHFLKCIIRDATGEAPARKWSFEPEQLAEVESTGFVWINGQTQNYNGQVQLILEEIRPVEVTEAEMAELLPSTTKSIDDMFARVEALLETLEHPAMKSLVRAYLDDAELMRRFRQAPAATSNHHAWIGGLLEHTLQLMELANLMLPLYPQLNRDLVLTGLFLHDLGKTSELTWERGFSYTLDGNLVGHVVSGAIWLQVKAAIAARSGERLPTDALKALQHIVLSHHGRLEFGAAKAPSTPEALFVSQLDDLDAKTTMGLMAADRAMIDQAPETGSGFTENIWALGTRIYRRDPLAEASPSS